MKNLLKKLAVPALCVALGLGVVGRVEAAEPTKAEITQALSKSAPAIFPLGELNSGYAKYFTGTSYLAAISKDGVPFFNVTFVNGAHTFWHVHHGTCQILIAESGRGYYQIWGQDAKVMLPGETVTIPAETKHWHGAAPGQTFQHITIMEPGAKVVNEWLEEVNAKDYAALK